VLLFLGRIHPKKGVDRLIEAWALLKAEHPDIVGQWVLAIAGWDDGGHEASLRTSVRQHRLERDVRFTGPLFGHEKERMLRHAGAFILPSHSEGLPIAVLEAWSYALPVFMTAACNIPSGFEVGAAFEISLQPSEIASRLAQHLDDPDGLRAAGKRGRELVASEFSWESIADEFVSVYRWLADGGVQPKSIT
jgi:poly(glycerol-phosphate) alpha-glucosyltransferase